MYKISTRGQYALLVMTDLAENEEGTYTPLKLLSHRRNLSVKYLEQILIQLGKAGLVTGNRGSNGGYKLNKDANEYTAGEILRAMEGELSPRSPSESPYLTSKATENFWTDFAETVNHYVDSVTLEQLAKKNREFSGFEYCI
ncbi:MAG: Rrf2 family transcriptional regulator [Treponema sp.]|nr:Rrf2 family transcriptional regulator [Treponema sp.]